jgi:hypothetical protein
VAVKIMVLPSYMAGKERRERMAIMETAISSSLSHPNIVQTYTYAVEPVRGNTDVQGHGGGTGLHDSSRSFPVMLPGEGAAKEEGSTPSAHVHSWEVRLVQEFCDKGSLKEALHGQLFRWVVGGWGGGGVAGTRAGAGWGWGWTSAQCTPL